MTSPKEATGFGDAVGDALAVARELPDYKRTRLGAINWETLTWPS
jgi:hypothetical protein